MREEGMATNPTEVGEGSGMTGIGAIAATVCKPCQRRKRKCDKALPSCSRCSRLLVKCWYPDTANNVDARAPVLPPLNEVIPGGIGYGVSVHGTSSGGPSTSSQSNSLPPLLPFHSTNNLWTFSFAKDPPTSFSIDEQVSMQARRLLDLIVRKRGPFTQFSESYFRNYQTSLPIVNEDEFYWKLENGGSEDAHFVTLALAVVNVTRLFPMLGPDELPLPGNPDEGLEDLYPTLKSAFSMLQSTGRVTLELIQTGILIASWEHSQALHQVAWLSIGTCVRMGQVMGLHTLLRTPMPENKEDRLELEMRRRVWWAVVLMERYILIRPCRNSTTDLRDDNTVNTEVHRIVNAGYENNQLPLASPPPTPEDILPSKELDDLGVDFRVKDDILLPKDIDLGNLALLTRGFTNFSPFACTIQSAYLAYLVDCHIKDTTKDEVTGRMDAARLEAALQVWIGALIPPAGKSYGAYVGALEFRTSAAYSLYIHELSYATLHNIPDSISRHTIAIQSLVRITIHATKTASSGSPIRFDTVAFWAQRVTFVTGCLHLRLGERNAEWIFDLQVLKDLLGYFRGRYRLYDNYILQLEAFEREALAQIQQEQMQGQIHMQS